MQHPPEPGATTSVVLVVIVNYRTGALVKANPGTRVAVVDNCSPDDSADVIARTIEEQGWSAWASLQRSPVNGGFAFGNNYAVRPALAGAAAPAYYWLLNPDTQVRPGALRHLVSFLCERPSVGIAGSSLEDENGVWWPIAFRFPSLRSELESGLRLGFVTRCLSKWTVARRMTKQPARVDWLPGASMMVKREVFESVGLMDEQYFLYFEETDYCLQAQQAGWECWYVPASRVMHIAGQSTGVTGTQAGMRRLPAYWFDSRRRYFVKNHGRLYAALADIVWIVGFSIWRVRRRIQRKPDMDPPQMLKDMIQHSAVFRVGLPGNPMLNAVNRAMLEGGER
jgi:N-acetylglucosaminyl-diphospho-decaprenol L-rhamnosyltransferase